MGGIEEPKKILIIEDNPLNRKLFRDVLTVHGFVTIEDSEGSQALALAHEHQPDLIILDIQLPHCSGIEITKAFKGDILLNTIPIMAVTALALHEQEAEALAAGCHYYLTKPFTIGSFLTAVKSFFPTEKTDKAVKAI